MADEIQIFEGDQLIACHPLLDGRRQRSTLAGHRQSIGHKDRVPIPPAFGGDLVPLRPLDIYAAVGRRLAAGIAA
jgi:hypothetical protein